LGDIGGGGGYLWADLGGDLGGDLVGDFFMGGGGGDFEGCMWGCPARGILKTHFKKIMLSLSLYCHVISVGM
jgi:hypothetical protein